jgi:exonuclease I
MIRVANNINTIAQPISLYQSILREYGPVRSKFIPTDISEQYLFARHTDPSTIVEAVHSHLEER